MNHLVLSGWMQITDDGALKYFSPGETNSPEDIKLMCTLLIPFLSRNHGNHMQLMLLCRKHCLKNMFRWLMLVVSVVDGSMLEEHRNHVALVVNQFSSAQSLVARFDHLRHRPASFQVTRGRNVFPDDLTVRVGPGDGLTLRVMPGTSREGPPNSLLVQDEQLDISISAQANADNHDAPAGNDLEDAFLMQAFQITHASQPINDACNSHNPGTTCALGISDEGSVEETAFHFNPAAPVFLPSAHVLPAWAQVIEDIYHDWDINAFAWQGEARATHFMTWYLAPGINRLQCLYGRKIALFADFWNWREQFRRQWADEIDPGADLEVVYVSPPPTQIEAGVVGHILLLQHNSVEWSSILLSVFDPAINAGHPFKVAQAFTEQLQFQQVLIRVGYAMDCSNLAQCHFQICGQTFEAVDWIRASDGDAIDLRVQRVVWPINWHPPIVPHMPGAEGLALLQMDAKRFRSKPSHPADKNARELQTNTVISLTDLLGSPTDDIAQIPFTLAALFRQEAARAQDLVLCEWEINHEVDVMMYPRNEFDIEQARTNFCVKHSLIKSCSDLYPVNFTRTQWAIRTERWYVGSFVPPDSSSAVVACVEYTSSGATTKVKTIPKSCKTDFLRSVMNIRFGTLIRLNGRFVGDSVHCEHGDVMEYHVGHQQHPIIDRRCHKVQLCLDAVIECAIPGFDIDDEAVEVLPYPSIQQGLSNEDSWVFRMIPEGTPLHKETYEALHDQCLSCDSQIDRYELYIDGATANSLSAWAVVAVKVSGDARCLMGCVAGLTEINRSSPRWIGAENHTNIDAELSAMAVATAFGYFAASEVPVTIRPDLALSRKFLYVQSTTRQLSTLAKVLHVLGQVKPKNIYVQEVRAHRGDPWNELADAIAKQVAATVIELGHIPWGLLNQIATSPSTIKWEWLRQEPLSFRQTMPALHGDAVWQPLPSSKQMNVQISAQTPTKRCALGFPSRLQLTTALPSMMNQRKGSPFILMLMVVQPDLTCSFIRKRLQ